VILHTAYLALRLLSLLAGPALNSPPLDSALWGSHWQGVIYIVPAQFEVDLELDLSHDSGGVPTGRISLPNQKMESKELDKLVIQGQSILFTYSDGKELSTFEGKLSSDLQTIEGLLRELGKTYRFTLHRGLSNRRSDTSRPDVRSLSDDGRELRARFAEDTGKVRLLLILSPSKGACRNSARIVRNYVLNSIKDAGIRVYVIWEAIQISDSEKSAQEASYLLPDERVTQFWSSKRITSSAFQEALGLKASLPWDVVLIFGPEAKWDDLAHGPKPADFMHNFHGADEELPADKHLNGIELVRKVGDTLRMRKE